MLSTSEDHDEKDHDNDQCVVRPMPSTSEDLDEEDHDNDHENVCSLNTCK